MKVKFPNHIKSNITVSCVYFLFPDVIVLDMNHHKRPLAINIVLIAICAKLNRIENAIYSPL